MTMPDQGEIDLYGELRDIIARLRAPDGCPWDREQTHESLRPFMIQEAFEVVAAIDSGETRRLPEEIGDLLFQVLIHTQLAEEAAEWTMAEVLRGLSAKLIRRHPHVFLEGAGGSGEEGGRPPSDRPTITTSAQVLEQWEDLKSAERETGASALDGLPEAMPALALAQEALRRAAAAGFAWPARSNVVAKLAEEIDELARVQSHEQRTEEFGDILINLANYARYIGVDAEESLRLATRKFRRRFEAVEGLVRERGLAMKGMSLEELLALWAEAKGAD